jgi:uncharacterized protein YjbI with pentapeptide repeats
MAVILDVRDGCSLRSEAQRMADDYHLALLSSGSRTWNAWRKDNPEARPNLVGADLRGQDFRFADLSSADLRHADLSHADLCDADFYHADISGAALEGARLWNADLGSVTAVGARLRDAELLWGNLSEADFRDADLAGAMLEGSNLSETNFEGANLSGAYVYAISAWRLKTDARTRQEDLTITRRYVSYLERLETSEPPVKVDNINMAQYAHLLLANPEIKELISTTASKSVLVLGRFCAKRKAVLDLLRRELRARGLIPIIFDWDPSPKRDLTETVQLLANMSRFVIADVTDAKSIPQELSAIVPNLPSVAVLPLVVASERPYALFEHWRRFPSVLPEYPYNDPAEIAERFDDIVMTPITQWEEATNKAKVREAALREENLRLHEELERARASRR